MSPYYKEKLKEIENIVIFAEEVDVKFKKIEILEEERITLMNILENKIIEKVKKLGLSACG